MGYAEHTSRKRQRQDSNLRVMFSITHQFSRLRRYNHFGTLAYIPVIPQAYNKQCYRMY